MAMANISSDISYSHPPERVPVGLSVSSTATVVHIQNSKTPAGEILDLQVESILSLASRPSVSLYQQWRQAAGRANKVLVLGGGGGRN